MESKKKKQKFSLQMQMINWWLSEEGDVGVSETSEGRYQKIQTSSHKISHEELCKTYRI